MGCYLVLRQVSEIALETDSACYFIEEGRLRYSQVFSTENNKYMSFLSKNSIPYIRISKKLAVKLNKLLTTV